VLQFKQENITISLLILRLADFKFRCGFNGATKVARFECREKRQSVAILSSESSGKKLESLLCSHKKAVSQLYKQ
jgi:hypothetical protein